MIEPARRESQTGFQVTRFEVRQLFQDLLWFESGSEEVEDIAHPNAHSAHARASAALFGVYSNALSDVLHCVNYISEARDRQGAPDVDGRSEDTPLPGGT